VKDITSKWKTEFLRKHQELKVSMPELPVNIYIDPDKIIQVLHNLLSNAVKFTPEKGRISIELRDEEDTVEVSIINTGVGIAKENLPRIFSKFEQFGRLDGPGEKGTGLGLAICKEIVRMHHGSIGVESEPGKGTKFTFSLPKKNIEAILTECVDSRIKAAMGRGTNLSLIAINIPEFNDIRQKQGHDASGTLLDNVEKAARDTLRRREDIVIKGTGEFVVLLFDAGKKDTAAISARIESTINAYLKRRREKWLKKVHCNFGHATYPEDAGNSKALLEHARAVVQI